MTKHIVGVQSDRCDDPDCEGCQNGIPGILYPKDHALGAYAKLALKDPTIGVYRLMSRAELELLAGLPTTAGPVTRETALQSVTHSEMRMAAAVLGVDLDDLFGIIGNAGAENSEG